MGYIFSLSCIGLGFLAGFILVWILGPSILDLVKDFDERKKRRGVKKA